MFLEYMSKETYLHRLDIRTKILGFVGIIILVFLFNNPFYNLIIAIMIGVLALSIKMPSQKVFDMLKPLLPCFILIIVLTSITYSASSFKTEISRRVLFHLLPNNGLGVSAGGFFIGCTLLVRIFILIFISTIFTLTTPIDDVLQFLHQIKVPYEISLIITTGIRFIPTMERKKNLIFQAQQARGANLKGNGITGPIRAYLPIMVPMIINSILMANNLSIAMLNRGYGVSKTWTVLYEMKFTMKDYLVITIIFLVTVLGIYVRYGLNKGII